ncbi:hypothetical protein JYU34_001313 [Plutella xylostella]|uniref:Uncharacterized protein n=1 Tax=Plutella xylostella TaxID=51655 RepID=A0ABQ7R6L3_PLUXY|nr:hypothetical protein JYU34_001313 [Plutella xylostella]
MTTLLQRAEKPFFQFCNLTETELQARVAHRHDQVKKWVSALRRDFNGTVRQSWEDVKVRFGTLKKLVRVFGVKLNELFFIGRRVPAR